MTIYNRYLLTLALVMCVTTLIFSIVPITLLGFLRLGVPFSVYLIECLIITELFIYLNPRARRNLSRVNYLLLTGFLALLVLMVLPILGIGLPF